ncbi:MAG: DUF4417 domain-containing protein [Clostridiales bacterium]
MIKCKNNCTSCKYIKRCGGCSLCEVLLCNNNCNSCGTVCFNKNNITGYLDIFKDFKISIDKNTYKQLPMHIPIIPEKIKDYERDLELDFVAINAGSIFSSNGEKTKKNIIKNGIYTSLNINKNSKLILEFYIKDRYLEGFWDNRFSIYKDLKDLNFDYVIAPNFSVYSDLPRIDHIYNIKRTSIVYKELLDHGINSIPDISWFNINDLDEWIREINRNDIKLISFSFQNVGVGLKPSNSWKQNLLGLNYLCSNIKNSVDIVTVGVVSPFRIAEIYNSINKSNKLVILNQSAFIQSRKGMLSEFRKQVPYIPFDKLFSKNLEYYNNIYKEIYKSDDIYSLSHLSKNDLIKYYKKQLDSKNFTNSDYTNNFLLRCLKNKKVKEVGSFQNQEEIHWQHKV